MKRKFVIMSIIVLMISFASIGIVSCDSAKGWEGYGVYNLNNSDITSLKEYSNITLTQEKILYKTELIIKNNTNQNQEVILGVPTSYVVSMYTGNNGKTIRNYRISSKSINKMLSDISGIPSIDDWRAFNFWQKPGEINVISLNLENSVNIDNEGIYTLNYLGDINMKSRVNSNMIELEVSLSNYEPFNLLKIEGPDFNTGLVNGNMSWKMDKNSLREISINYQFTEKRAMDYILKNNNREIERLVDLYKSKSYGEVINAAAELLKKSTENDVANIIKYLMCESYIKMNMEDDYINMSQSIDLNNIFPKELSYKILLDRVEYYKYKADSKKMNEEVAKLKEISDNSFVVNYAESLKSNKENSVVNSNNNKIHDDDNKKSIELYMQNFNEIISENKFFIFGILLIVFILGFIVGRMSRGDRRGRRNNYLFKIR